MKTSIIDNPNALFWASFNSFEMRLSAKAVMDIAQPGDNMQAVKAWADRVRQQVEADNFTLRPTPEKIRAELAESGGWSNEELKDDEANWLRIIWTAAHNIAEDDAPDCSEPVNDAPSLFSRIVAAGIRYDSHESDLYLPDTPEVRAIMADFPLERGNARPFRSLVDDSPWLDVPFVFMPYWEAKAATNLPAQS